MAPTLQDRPDVAVFSEIGVIEHLIRQSVAHHLPPGMTYAHFELLQHFHRVGDGQTPAELAREMMLSKAALTNILQRMSALGLVSVLGDVSDGRKKRVRLTRAGQETHAGVLKDMKWKMDLLREGFTEGEFRQALPFLRNLRLFLEEVSAGPAPEASSRR
ncbi:MarR family transcriptional regulator [Phenylobacterium sp.]|uniref:MarR family winged helix-turn-helix transcriptional regulator n=1 Tax=Phenylobacterium sp. TaxID=1871053 RepID=UPI002898119F|nr:MarR family transcriptional regulator [Phenylobacterium sp.]